MLAQAKRPADLQKRRELKQAGLMSKKAATKSRKRSRDIDLDVEIPFHKPAPAGLHDTSPRKRIEPKTFDAKGGS
jgi:pre-mRNA-splicing factor CDC5/CEF1